MKVQNATIARGICKAASQCGVSYNHLWKVLTGRYESAPLVLKIAKVCPSLFKTERCTIDYQKVIDDNRSKYKWDVNRNRYVLKSGKEKDR